MKTSLLPALTLFTLVCANQAFAQTPRTINYQGVLSDSKGVVIADGTRSLTVRLYDAPTGGTILYTETQTVRVTRGVFNMTIGMTAPIPMSLLFDRPYYIGITVDNNAELLPRTALTASPYAMRSTIADVADSISPTARGVVTSVNGASGAIEFVGGVRTQITRSGNTITITALDTGRIGVQSVNSLDPSITVVGSNTAAPKVGVANWGITTVKIADGAITDAKVANGISYSKIIGGPTMLPPIGGAEGDLTGSYPAPRIAPNAVTTAKIADGAVTNPKIGNEAISTEKVADNAVTSAKIANGTIMDADVATNAAVAYSKLNLANSIVANDLTNNAVTTPKVADGAITDAKVANGISYAKLSGAPASLPPSGPATGDLSGTYPNPTVAANAITSAKIADGTIVDADVAASAAIAYAKLNLTNSIQNGDITANAITTSKVANGTVTTSKLADSAVSGLKLLTNAVTDRHIADGAVTLPKINTTGAAAGQVIQYDGANLVWGASTPVGSAGGDLTGTYPNPTIANGAITSAKIADGTIADADVATNAAIAYSKLSLTNSIQNGDITANAITTSKVANGTVTTSKLADSAVSGLKLLTFAVTNRHIADGAVTLPKINTTGAAAGQVIQYDGANLVWGSSAPTGAAGGDLSGTYPNPTVADNAITSLKIADGAVNNADLAVNSVTTSRVANGTVTTSKLADSAVSGLKLLTFAVTNRHLADGAVTTSKLSGAGAADGQVLTFDGGTNSVTWSTPAGGATGAAGGDLTGTYPNPTVADNAITSLKIADNAITSLKIADGAVNNADLAVNSVTTSRVANGTVTTSKLADSAVSGLKLLTFAVTNRHIADGAVTLPKISAAGAAAGDVIKFDGANIVWGVGGGATGAAGGDLTGTYPNPTVADNAITSLKIADGAVNNADLAVNSVTTSRVANGTVTTSKLADSAVSGLKLLTFAVTNRHLADGAVTGSKLSVPFSATVNTGSNAFSITNSGAAFAGSFIGSGANSKGLYIEAGSGQTGLELNQGRMVVSYDDGVVAPAGVGGTVAIPDGNVMVVIRAGATTGGYNITLPNGVLNGQVLNIYNSDANTATVTSGNVLNASTAIGSNTVMQYTWVTTNGGSGWVGQ